MNTPPSTDIRVCVDVGSRKHSVAVGLADGRFLDAFEVDHRPERFDRFFQRIDDLRRHYGGDGRVQRLGSSSGRACAAPPLPPVQRQQPQTGAAQGDLPYCCQNRPARRPQGAGAVPAMRPPTLDQKGVARGGPNAKLWGASHVAAQRPTRATC